jgi:hypothetical protein
MGISTALANAWLNAYFSVPRYMSLHKASPGVAGSLAQEVPTIGTGYARQSLVGKLGIAANGLVTNTQVLTFPTITAEYGGPVTDFAACDALTGGTIGLFGAFNESLLKGVGGAYQYPAGAIRFQLR